jgi:fatty acid synthase subunit alpha, fungi type
MMPSAVKAGLISAILNVGYHVKPAGRGHYNAAVVVAKVTEI